MGDTKSDASGSTAPVEPPDLLYHATEAQALNAIFASGLHAGDEGYLMLQTDRERALENLAETEGKAVVLEILSGIAHRAGVQFYKKGPGFTVKSLPAGFLRVAV